MNLSLESSGWKVGSTRSSETSVTAYKVTRVHNAEDHNHNFHMHVHPSAVYVSPLVLNIELSSNCVRGPSRVSAPHSWSVCPPLVPAIQHPVSAARGRSGASHGLTHSPWASVAVRAMEIVVVQRWFVALSLLVLGGPKLLLYRNI
jgi:hypothetical protein